MEKSKADGDAIRKELMRRDGALLDNGHVWRLDDTQTTVRRSEIQRELRNVKSTLSQVAPNDLLVIFLSGHGHAAAGKYRFVPSTPAFKNDRQVLEDGICLSDFDIK